MDTEETTTYLQLCLGWPQPLLIAYCSSNEKGSEFLNICKTGAVEINYWHHVTIK